MNTVLNCVDLFIPLMVCQTRFIKDNYFLNKYILINYYFCITLDKTLIKYVGKF